MDSIKLEHLIQTISGLKNQKKLLFLRMVKL